MDVMNGKNVGADMEKRMIHGSQQGVSLTMYNRIGSCGTNKTPYISQYSVCDLENRENTCEVL